MADRKPELLEEDAVLALDRPATVFRALRIGSAMLALMGFAAIVAIVGQSLHAPVAIKRLDAILGVAIVVLLIIAPLSWFAINAMKPGLLLPIAGLGLWPVVPYYQYIERAGGTFGPDLIYGIAVPNIPIAFVLWAGFQGIRLTPSERVITRSVEPNARYVTVLRSLFGVWPGLVRSPLQATISGVLVYLAQVLHGLTLAIVGGFILIAPGEIRSGSAAALSTILIVFGLAACLMATAAGLRNLGRLVSRQSLERQIGRDQRRSILFLRAFQDDQATLPRGRLLHRFLRAEFGRRRLDHVLVEEFSRFGPVVALGRPGQRTLPFGAARIYVSHDDWQTKVLELAEKAAHIVLVADAGAGVEWEIEMMLSSSLREKTLFLATERLGDLRQSPPLRSLLMTNVESGYSIGLFEQADERPIVLTVKRPSPEAYIVALQAFFRRSRFVSA